MTKLLAYSDLKAIGIASSKATINRLIRIGKFPKPVRLSEGPTSRPLWPENEIRAWLKAKLAARYTENADAR